MISALAHQVAGTYLPPSSTSYSRMMSWIRLECLSGRLAAPLRRFCHEQLEMLEPDRLELRGINDEAIRCAIPCRVSDHESNQTFIHEVRFDMDPLTGQCRRLDELD